MAGDGERRMVFDIRGRRKHVVKVVYAILALLMGSSLFLVVGPLNIGELLGGSSGTSASSIALEQVERVEKRLRKEPSDEDLVAALVRARINAARAFAQVDPTTGLPKPTPESRTQNELAAEAWLHYLKLNPKPLPNLAAAVAVAQRELGETSSTYPELQRNFEAAAKAQTFVTEARPTLNALSILAFYNYFAFNFKQGDKAAKQTEALATSKTLRKSAKKQFAAYRKRAKKLQKEAKAAAKALKGQGKEKLENPLGGLSSSGSTLAP